MSCLRFSDEDNESWFDDRNSDSSIVYSERKQNMDSIRAMRVRLVRSDGVVPAFSLTMVAVLFGFRGAVIIIISSSW